MQTKILAAVIFLFVGGLVAFNMMNASKVNSDDSAAVEVQDAEKTSATSKQGSIDSANKISDKPLAQQPKAMVDNASDKIATAQKLEQENREQLEAIQ